MYSADDILAALFAREIDDLARTWAMTTEEALRWHNEQSSIIAQPTTISASKRAPGIQVSLFDCLETLEEADIIPNLARYKRGKEVIASAQLVSARSRKALESGPVVKVGKQFYSFEVVTARKRPGAESEQLCARTRKRDT